MKRDIRASKYQVKARASRSRKFITREIGRSSHGGSPVRRDPAEDYPEQEQQVKPVGAEIAHIDFDSQSRAGTSNQQGDPLFPSGKAAMPEYRDGKAIEPPLLSSPPHLTDLIYLRQSLLLATAMQCLSQEVCDDPRPIFCSLPDCV